MTQECGVSTGDERQMNNSSRCRFVAMLPPPSLRQIASSATGAQFMKHAHASSLSSTAAGTSILLAATVLTSPAHAVGATGIGTGLYLADVAKAGIWAGYRVAPALMLGLALAVGLPILTLLARIVQPLLRSSEATRRYRPGTDDAVDAELAGVAGQGGGLPFVEFENGGKGMRCALLRDMLRIGREDDNDIRIPSGSVHRYHAAIHREDYDDWHITDLSGVEGNGLIVNGRRCCEARLNDGDLIQLGPGRLRFRAGFA
jgi:hypothetical protein